MQLKQLLNDDDAVSPVIGVILMVAITVILAAVIGTFVLGLGDQVQDTSPNAQLSTDYDGANQELTITHQGGQELERDQIAIVAGSNTYHLDGSSEFDGVAVADGHWWGPSGEGISAGDSITLGADADIATGANDDGTDRGYGSDFTGNEEVRVIWSSGDQSDTLVVWED